MERRTFLAWATNGLGAVFAAVVGVPAVAYLIDARNRKPRPSGFREVIQLSELPVGVPKQVVIRDLRRDAWTLHPNDVVGRVWLIRGNDKAVTAFTTICPHLGCSINFEAKQNLFICPCHNATFQVDGQPVATTAYTNPAPRGMDKLKVRVVPDPDDPADSLVEVEYLNFEQGKHTPIVKS